MPRNQKESQGRELEEQERDDADAPRVDELDEEDRGVASSKIDADADEEIDEDDIAQEIDIEDLAAMEGPDA